MEDFGRVGVSDNIEVQVEGCARGFLGGIVSVDEEFGGHVEPVVSDV